jgi:hypothetical protein
MIRSRRHIQDERTLQGTASRAVAAKADSKKVTDRMIETSAAFDGMQSTSLRNTSVSNNMLNIDLFPLLKGIVPDGYENFPLLNNLYRDIYYYDNVAGAAADLMSTLPFSDITLGGVSKDQNQLLGKFYESLDRINIFRLLPEMSIDYLVLGTFIGTLVFNKQKGIFTDIIPQDIDHCKISPLPFYGQDPIINVTVARETLDVLNSKSKRIERIKKRLGEDIIKKLQGGSFELDNLTTLYVPRKALSNREGISYYKRILPIYLLEKNLFKGTLIESAKRQRAILHITAGNGMDWEPTLMDLEYLTELFMNADADPIGAIVATRSDINVADIRQGGDFWNITSVWSETVPAKLRALGISESFLSGDANYNSAEAALSVFIEGLRSYRDMLTRKVFYDKLFPLISVVNGYYKNADDARKWKKKGMDPEEILYELQDNSSLVIPQVHWHKQLKPEGDTDYIQMLNTLTEAGVPVSLRTMAAAGGLSLDALIQEMDDDFKVRKMISEQKKRLEGGGGAPESEDDSEEASDLHELFTTLGHVSSDNPYISATHRKLLESKGKASKGLLGREYGVASDIIGETKSGKPKYISNQKGAHAKMNRLIAKAAEKLHKDEAARAKHESKR